MIIMKVHIYRKCEMEQNIYDRFQESVVDLLSCPRSCRIDGGVNFSFGNSMYIGLFVDKNLW